MNISDKNNTNKPRKFLSSLREKILFGIMLFLIFIACSYLFYTEEIRFREPSEYAIAVDGTPINASPKTIEKQDLEKLPLSYKKRIFDKFHGEPQSDFDFDKLPDSYIEQVLDELNGFTEPNIIKGDTNGE